MSKSRGKSLVVKRAIVIRGHNTSVSLEEPFWSGLKEIAAKRGASLNELVAQINEARDTFNLSSAIRQFVLAYYQQGVDESL
ncbi:ribbon-helix-helix domain-containing protein [Tardiphaga sp. 804_B3_N1_9]|uniref:ribbon-helix-helix domain-containing protein n=1 Tax=Tardiphaga sp. 804_B3_N1_9 TaxID=3240786 RepID=UPI003F1F8F9B